VQDILAPAIALVSLIAVGCFYSIAIFASWAGRWRESEEGRAWADERRARRRGQAHVERSPSRIVERSPSRIGFLEERLDARIDALSGRLDDHIDRPAG
jgi:hypothetical protein